MLRPVKYLSATIPCCFLSAAILVLPFSNGKLWFFSWFGYLPLFVALKDKSRLQSFLLAYFTGVIFWSATIWWLANVTYAGTILLILYLALYFGLFGLLVSSCLLPTIYYLLFIPSVWVLLEYLRSHLLTGFPWALAGYSQYLNLPLIQIADITGAWGVSFLILLVNAAVYLGFIKKEKKAVILTCLLLVTAALGYGYYRVHFFAGAPVSKSIRVSVIQANIPQDLKWERRSRDFIIARYISLSLRAAKDMPDLIIWPEASLPVVPEEEPLYYERVKGLARQIKTPILLGAVTFRDNNYYNSCLLVSAEGNDSGRYEKVHLVPFGEYIPLRKIFWFLDTIVPIGEITPGKEYTVFNGPAKFSALVCFEDLFSGLSRRFVKEGAVFLVNITNDAWYKMTPAPYQHLQASVFRAIENRVSLVRSANTGVSCFISPSGKIVSYVNDDSGRAIFVTGYATQDISADRQSLSFYSRHGDVFVLLLFIFAAYGMFRTHPV